MAKAKSVGFFCTNCGYETSKWMGQCPGCREWNSFAEQPTASTGRGVAGAAGSPQRIIKPVPLSTIRSDETARMTTGMGELDLVLGGGIVPGSLVLVGGDPGIGKSTLLLQMCRLMAKMNRKILYVSGEESGHQIKMRADRIGPFSENLWLFCETNLAQVQAAIEQTEPEVVVIDSIQTMFQETVTSAPGSISQVRESTNVLMQTAKSRNCSIFIVGHVTKEGVVAGPRMLEHMVDTVLYFEGERHASYRILRSVKNRFGSTNEIGVFEMRDTGLSEVENPSEYMLSGRPKHASGSVVTCSMEGTRPVLLEVQALVCQTNLAFPRRTTVGADLNRINLILAVLEKRIGIRFSSCDAYVNITGGLRLNEPSLDLGIALALVSSLKDVSIPEEIMIFGEIGLSGEVRAVSMPKQRVLEAKKLGFSTVILPKVVMKTVGNVPGIRLVGVATLQEAVGVVLRDNG